MNPYKNCNLKDFLPFIDDALTVSNNVENEIVNRQSLFEALPGHTISGDIIAKAIEESNRTKKPISKILQDELSNKEFTTVLYSGKAILKMEKEAVRNKML